MIASKTNHPIEEVSDVKRLLTREEAAELMSISVRQLANLMARGEISVVRIGKSVRFRPEHINEFVARNTTGSTNPGTP